MTYRKKIEKLQSEFGESTISRRELVSSSYHADVDKKYKEKQDIFMIDQVLSNLEPRTRKMLKKEVYQVCGSVRLKDLCYNCKIEAIIAVIILYVWKTRHHRLHEDETRLWKKYDLTYKKYSLILGRLLQKTREMVPLKNNL